MPIWKYMPYESILGETLGKQAIETAGIRIMLFDPITEEIAQWISETLRRVLTGYAGEMLNGYSYLTSNAGRTVLGIISLGYIGDWHFVDAGLIARLVGNTIVIEHDVNK
jgi:hypothetical protein